ncbi:MAG: type IV pilin protein [Gammaproteobacteria bacterium]
MRIDFKRDLRWPCADGSRRPLGLARMRGVTLIELLTVVAVLAIISTIAVSSYRRYLIRTNRTEATAALLRIQVAQEKFFLQNNTYSNNVAMLGVLSPTPSGNYSLGVAAGTSSDLATSFTATATPQSRQAAQDTDCQTLTIDDQGQRGSTPGPTSTCWK